MTKERAQSERASVMAEFSKSGATGQAAGEFERAVTSRGKHMSTRTGAQFVGWTNATGPETITDITTMVHASNQQKVDAGVNIEAVISPYSDLADYLKALGEYDVAGRGPVSPEGAGRARDVYKPVSVLFHLCTGARCTMVQGHAMLLHAMPLAGLCCALVLPAISASGKQGILAAICIAQSCVHFSALPSWHPVWGATGEHAQCFACIHFLSCLSVFVAVSL
jgi:hypothetical protein